MKIFIPKMYQKDIFKIDYKKLKYLNYKVLIFDLDNTLGYPKEEICNKKTSEFLNKLQNNFIVIIASNSLKKRVSKFVQNLSCDYFSFSLKPSLKVFRKIKKKYNVNYNEMVIIGDQVMTDMLAGNRIGALTILVDPINEDLKITALNRKLENIINKKNNVIRGDYYEEK